MDYLRIVDRSRYARLGQRFGQEIFGEPSRFCFDAQLIAWRAIVDARQGLVKRRIAREAKRPPWVHTELCLVLWQCVYLW